MTTINKKAYIAPNVETYVVNAKQMISASTLTPNGNSDISVTVSSDDSYNGDFYARESAFDWDDEEDY